MLTAMTAVENIVNGIQTKENIWAINTEMEYQEEKGPQDKSAQPNRRDSQSGVSKVDSSPVDPSKPDRRSP
jgi:hypothetical protein